MGLQSKEMLLTKEPLVIIHTVKHMTPRCTLYLQGISWLYPENKYDALQVFLRLLGLYYGIDFCICHHIVTLKCISELVQTTLEI